jgi:hypothetical protein
MIIEFGKVNQSRIFYNGGHYAKVREC